MADDDKRSAWLDTGKWLIGISLLITSGYFAHQGDIGQKIAARFKTVGDILSEMTKTTTMQGQQIDANKENIKRIEAQLNRHVDRSDDRFDRHEDKDHE